MVDHGVQGLDVATVALQKCRLSLITKEVSQYLLNEAALSGYTASEPDKELWQVLSKLDDFSSRFQLPSECIGDWIREIIWVSRIDKTQKLLSSGSYLELPGICFLTNIAGRYIPPEVVFPNYISYAILENLFHESLHLLLYAAMDLAVLCDETVDEEPILVPWQRGEPWRMRRAFQSWFVYENVATLRQEAASQVTGPEREQIRHSVEVAQRCAAFFREALVDRISRVGPLGLDLLKASGPT